MSKKVICLFDIDGTLTKPQNVQLTIRKLSKMYQKHFKSCSKQLIQGQLVVLVQIRQQNKSVRIVFFIKSNQQCQLYLLRKWIIFVKKWIVFSIKRIFCQKSISKELGEDFLKEFINFCLKYISEIDIPIKRGTFIEFRKGMLNISPIGRNCSQQERDEFEQYDKSHNIRKQFIEKLKEKFPNSNLQYSIGGQISFDVFPKNWDKTYCLRFLDEYETVYFLGDKTFEGGNDFEIITHPRTKGISVTCPQDTIDFLTKEFNLQLIE